MNVRKDNWKRNQKSQGKFYRCCYNVRKDSVAGAFKLFDESIPKEEKHKRVYWKDLNSRRLDGLFQVNSPDRIYVGAPSWRSFENTFNGRWEEYE